MKNVCGIILVILTAAVVPRVACADEGGAIGLTTYKIRFGSCDKKLKCDFKNGPVIENSVDGPVPGLKDKTECMSEGIQCWEYFDLSSSYTRDMQQWNEASGVPLLYNTPQ